MKKKNKVLEITQFGNPVLRKKAKRVPVADIKKGKYDQLIADMFATIRAKDGAGVAAPQINKSIQLTVIEIPAVRGTALEPTVVFNPRITRYSRKKVNGWEGCLSFPELRGKVPRPVNIDVEYINKNGEKVKETHKGFHARVFQHEIDHLNGILFTDRMKDMSTLMTLEEFEKRIVGK